MLALKHSANHGHSRGKPQKIQSTRFILSALLCRTPYTTALQNKPESNFGISAE